MNENGQNHDALSRLIEAMRGNAPETLIVAAHPDDDVIGAGALLADLGPAARVAYLTDGAPADGIDARAYGFDRVESYARARRAESDAALKLAGVDPARVHWLGWKDQTPALELLEVTLTLVDLIELHSPEIVITHAYEGGHPDHDAAAFAVAQALALIRAKGARAPAALEMTSYHATDEDSFADEFITGRFLPRHGAGRERRLIESQRELKGRMLAAHSTQARTVEPFLATLDCERFRVAPDYDFTAPPHSGPLWYERFNWGLSPERWRELARDAMAALNPQARGKAVTS